MSYMRFFRFILLYYSGVRNAESRALLFSFPFSFRYFFKFRKHSKEMSVYYVTYSIKMLFIFIIVSFL